MSEKEDNIRIIKDEQKITKLPNGGFVFTKEFEAEMTSEDKEEIESKLKKDIDSCRKVLKDLTEDHLNLALNRIEQEGKENLEKYKEKFENIDELVKPETLEEFEKRKKETIEELKMLIEHNDEAVQLAKDRIKQMFNQQKSLHEIQLKQQEELLKLYEENFSQGENSSQGEK